MQQRALLKAVQPLSGFTGNVTSCSRARMLHGGNTARDGQEPRPSVPTFIDQHLALIEGMIADIYYGLMPQARTVFAALQQAQWSSEEHPAELEFTILRNC
jgi:hypothetical protein